MPREAGWQSYECFAQPTRSIFKPEKVRLIIIVNMISISRYRLRLLIMITCNWDKGLSFGATSLILPYLFMMSIQVCRKEISSEIALLADLALVGPKRYISEY
jgi:hypothetical protein